MATAAGAGQAARVGLLCCCAAMRHLVRLTVVA